MTVELTVEKKERIKNMGIGLLSKDNRTIRMVSSFIGNLTASFEAVPYGRLYYRHLEFSKTSALEASKYDFDAQCPLSEQALGEIGWWINNIGDSFAYIRAIPDIDQVIYTDASKHQGGGWGASDGVHDDINGRWSLEEQKLDINCLELKAIKLAIQSYTPLYKECRHIRIMSDNTSAIAYLNKQGGTHNMIQNDLSVKIWEYMMDINIHISAAHIPGKHNVLADEASRKFQDAAEWKLDTKLFRKMCRYFDQPDIDLFASRLNYQLSTYASWLPDPESTYIDAMSVFWKGKYIYAFPPFSMIWPVLNKIASEKVEKALLVVPRWPTQSWFPTVNRMRHRQYEFMVIPSTKLTLPGTTNKHPMSPKLRLMAIMVTGCQKLQR